MVNWDKLLVRNSNEEGFVSLPTSPCAIRAAGSPKSTIACQDIISVRDAIGTEQLRHV
jgi:hypothetical protein